MTALVRLRPLILALGCLVATAVAQSPEAVASAQAASRLYAEVMQALEGPQSQRTIPASLQARIAAEYRRIVISLPPAGHWTGAALGETGRNLCEVAGWLRMDDSQLFTDTEAMTRLLMAVPCPRPGLRHLVDSLVGVGYALGRVRQVTDLIQGMYRESPGDPAQMPKRLWLAAHAARLLINLAREPEVAIGLLDEAMRELEGTPEWDEAARQALLADADIWLLRKERPKAGSHEECRGQLLLLRGFAHLEAGHLESSLDDLTRARTCLERTEYKLRLANVDHNLAGLWLRLGDLDRAESHARRAEMAYREGNLEEHGIQDRNGILAMQKVRAQVLVTRDPVRYREEARRLIEELRTEIAKSWVQTNADTYAVWAEVLLAGPGPLSPADDAELKRLFDEGLGLPHLRNHRWLAARLWQLKARWELGNKDAGRARKCLEEAQRIVDVLPNVDVRVHQHLVAARTEMLEGDPRAALREYATAARQIATVVEQERLWAFGQGVSSFQATYADALRGSVDAFLQLQERGAVGDPAVLEELFGILEYFHGYETAWTQHLSRVLGRKQEREPDTSTTALRERLAAAERELSRLQIAAMEQGPAAVLGRRRLPAALDAVYLAQLELERHTFRVDGMPSLPGPISLPGLQQQLVDGELFVGWLDLGERVAAICVDSGGASLLEFESPGFREDGAAGSTRFTPERLEVLGARLLDPIRGWLARSRTLILSPEGELSRVPFAALPWRGRRLVEQFALAFTPSATAFARQRETTAASRRPSELRLLALGNPSRSGADAGVSVARSGNLDLSRLPPLPWSANEVVDIGKLFASNDERAILDVREPARLDTVLRGARFTVCLGSKATRSALDSMDRRGLGVLHFACHGFADSRAPALSCLVLAREGVDDGLLRLAELSRLQGEFELVALSACDTGTGPIRGHDGPASLARGAGLGGARRVLATLWRVPDDATAALVVDFYRRWLVDGNAAATALAAAQCAADARGVAPQDWGAFTLWGEPR